MRLLPALVRLINSTNDWLLWQSPVNSKLSKVTVR